MKRTNQALAFVKPHAVGNRAAMTFIEDTWDDHGITVVHGETLTGPQIEQRGIVDRHYAVNARVGTCHDPNELYMDDRAREQFATAFDESWDDVLEAGRVISGLIMQKQLGISGEALNTIWARHGAHKLTGGLYVGYFPAEDRYVMNGFYPSIREVLCAADAVVDLMILEFDALELPWRRFRSEVIGSTNPAAADENSIRGFMYARQEALGFEVTYRENVIHASASAFEALTEKHIWLPDWPMEQDPVWSILQEKGIALDQLMTWRDDNPVVTLEGRTGPLVDLLEDRDTGDVVDLLLELAETTQRSEPDRQR